MKALIVAALLLVPGVALAAPKPRLSLELGIAGRFVSELLQGGCTAVPVCGGCVTNCTPARIDEDVDTQPYVAARIDVPLNTAFGLVFGIEREAGAGAREEWRGRAALSYTVVPR